MTEAKARGSTVVMLQPLHLLRLGGRVASGSKVGTAAGIIILLFIVISLTAPVITPHDPLSQDYNTLLAQPSGSHLLGTDQIGRDVLSRLIYGTRTSLMVGFASVGIAVVVGVPLGLLSGYARGAVDEVIMRVMDALIAFPGLILALMIVTVLKPTSFNVMIAIGVHFIPLFARLVRSRVLALRDEDFVLAARSVGAGRTRVVVRHILPNSLSPIIVQCTLDFGFAILAEASLGFLGVGVQPPTPTWGNMLNQGAPLLQQAPWLSIFPGLTIFLLVLSFNLLGDTLRDHFDPRLRGI